MSDKMKIILVSILTILMIIGIKFGGKNEDYFVDLEINRLYEVLNNAVLKAEEVDTDKTMEELQNDIYAARKALEETNLYLKEKGDPEYSEKGSNWSVKIDNVQQRILNTINEAISRATVIRSVDAIEDAKNIIPSNLPETYKSKYLKTLEGIKPYENLEPEAFELADKALSAIRKTVQEKEAEVNVIQNNINEARKAMNELKNYSQAKNITNYNATLGTWSTMMDTTQQNIIKDIEEKLKKAEKTKDKNDINEVKDSIPENLPEVWKNKFQERLKI